MLREPAPLVLLVVLGLQAQQVQQVLRDHRAPLVPRAPQGRRDILVSLGLKELVSPLVRLVHRAHKELKGLEISILV